MSANVIIAVNLQAIILIVTIRIVINFWLRARNVKLKMNTAVQMNAADRITKENIFTGKRKRSIGNYNNKPRRFPVNRYTKTSGVLFYRQGGGIIADVLNTKG